MKANIIRLLALITGVVVFDYLFYQEYPGINAMILAPILIILVWISGRNPLANRITTIASLGLLIAGLSIALHPTAVSILAYFGSLAIFLGLTLIPELRSPVSSFIHSGFNFLFAPLTLGSELNGTIKLKEKAPAFWKILKLLIIPILLLSIFITIYRYANPVFNRIFYNFDLYFEQFRKWIEQYLSLGHIVFLVFATFVFTGILYTGRHTIGSWLEKNRKDQLHRIRREKSVSFFKVKMMGLKDEYRTGMIILLMLNLLLLLVNITEIMWLNGEYHNTSAPEMSQNVHEGTGLLIFSIVLSILILLTLFRKNLNFYPKNAWLVRGAISWILLNMIMGVNVALRNWFYISQYGLTYKRIGVYFFLALVLAGLVLLLIKIIRKKTTWFLVYANAWVFYTAFILLAFVHWDSMIISYNARKSATSCDVKYLLDLSNDNLRHLMEHRTELQGLSKRQESTTGKDFENIDEILDKKAEELKSAYESNSWQSLNINQWKTYRYLIRTGKISAKADKP
jgi:hypothetical protein